MVPVTFGSSAPSLVERPGPKATWTSLVEMEPGCSLMDHVALMRELEKLLQRNVYVVSERALHWYIRDRMLAEAPPLLANYHLTRIQLDATC